MNTIKKLNSKNCELKLNYKLINSNYVYHDIQKITVINFKSIYTSRNINQAILFIS